MTTRLRQQHVLISMEPALRPRFAIFRLLQSLQTITMAMPRYEPELSCHAPKPNDRSLMTVLNVYSLRRLHYRQSRLPYPFFNLFVS